MKRTAISRWELSDHFWAESDPPEPCGSTATVKGGFLRKCARRLDRLTTDKKVKYRLTNGHRGGNPAPEPQRISMDRGGCCGAGGGGGRRASDAAIVNHAIVVNDSELVTLPPPPACVIKMSNDLSGARGTDTLATFPFREVSIYYAQMPY